LDSTNDESIIVSDSNRYQEEDGSNVEIEGTTYNNTVPSILSGLILVELYPVILNSQFGSSFFLERLQS